MSLKSRIESLENKDAELRKARMVVAQLDGEFNAEMQGVLKELGLPEQFSILQLIKTVKGHSEIIKP